MGEPGKYPEKSVVSYFGLRLVVILALIPVLYPVTVSFLVRAGWRSEIRIEPNVSKSRYPQVLLGLKENVLVIHSTPKMHEQLSILNASNLLGSQSQQWEKVSPERVAFGTRLNRWS